MLLFIFLTGSLVALPCFGQQVYITVQPGNCVNCTSKLYELHRLKNLNKINIVIQGRFQESKKDIEELYEFNSIKKFNIIYSDSLFETISKAQFFPELVAFNGAGSEIYRSVLTKINLKKIEQLFSNDAAEAPEANSPICMEGVNMEAGASFNTSADLAIFQDVFNRFSFVSQKNPEIHSVKIQKDEYEKLYRFFYQTDFERKYPGVEIILEKFKSFKPQATNLFQYNGQLYSLIQLRDWEKTSATDTTIYIKTIVGEWDKTNSRIKKMYNLSPELNRIVQVGLHDIYVMNGKLGCKFADRVTDQFSFALVHLDDKTEQLVLDEKIPIALPSEYRVKNINPYMTWNIRARAGLIAFDYSNHIFALPENKNIPIPFPELNMKSFEDRIITDVQRLGKDFAVLHMDAKKENFITVFNEEGLIKHIALPETKGNFDCRFSGKNQVVFIDHKGDGCVHFIDWKY